MEKFLDEMVHDDAETSNRQPAGSTCPGSYGAARDQGWTIRVLNRVTVACTHPEAGELVVSALLVRPGGRRLLDAELQQPDAAKEPTAERQLAVWINPDLRRL